MWYSKIKKLTKKQTPNNNRMFYCCDLLHVILFFFSLFEEVGQRKVHLTDRQPHSSQDPLHFIYQLPFFSNKHFIYPSLATTVLVIVTILRWAQFSLSRVVLLTTIYTLDVGDTWDINQERPWQPVDKVRHASINTSPGVHSVTRDDCLILPSKARRGLDTKIARCSYLSFCCVWFLVSTQVGLVWRAGVISTCPRNTRVRNLFRTGDIGFREGCCLRKYLR